MVLRGLNICEESEMKDVPPIQKLTISFVKSNHSKTLNRNFSTNVISALLQRHSIRELFETQRCLYVLSNR